MPSPERRAAGRVPVAFRARLGEVGTRATRAVHVADVSTDGILIESDDPTLPLGRESVVEIALPRNGVLRAHAVETRRAAAPGGSGLRVGLRLGEPWTVAADGRLAPSAVPPQPAFARPRSVARAELLHLGAAAMVLSLVEPRAALPPPLVAWLARLAAELGAPTPVRMETPSALTDAVASLWERT